jgi:predicted Zn-dependent protease
MQMLKSTPLWYLVILIFLLGCTIQRSPVTGQKRAYQYSWSQEVEIGKSVDPEVVAQFGLYENEQLSAYQNEIGAMMLKESHLRRPETAQQVRETEFTFRMLDSPVINAFALPGGYVYMTRGMMAHLNNEAQFAVVLGHEIGHVAARHASQRALSQSIGQLVVVGGAILGQELLDLPGQTIMELSSTAAQLLFLSYSRDNEREADRLGVEYAALNGYDAAEGAELFTSLERISAAGEQEIPNFLSTHPDPGERVKNIPEQAEKWAQQGYEQREQNQERYMKMIDGLIYGENPRYGYRDEVFFYHPELAFKFVIPEGWQMVNQPSQVVCISPNQEAISLLGIDQESATPQQSVRAITRQDGVAVVEEGTALSSDRWEAYIAIARTTLEDGQTLQLHIYAVAYDERIYRFVNYTSPEKYRTYEFDFVRITRSFDQLTDPDKLNIQPVRLHTVRAPRTDRFRSFLPNPLPMNIEPQEMAILNQVELDEQIERGQWLKLPTQD